MSVGAPIRSASDSYNYGAGCVSIHCKDDCVNDRDTPCSSVLCNARNEYDDVCAHCGGSECVDVLDGDPIQLAGEGPHATFCEASCAPVSGDGIRLYLNLVVVVVVIGAAVF